MSDNQLGIRNPFYLDSPTAISRVRTGDFLEDEPVQIADASDAQKNYDSGGGRPFTKSTGYKPYDENKPDRPFTKSTGYKPYDKEILGTGSISSEMFAGEDKKTLAEKKPPTELDAQEQNWLRGL